MTHTSEKIINIYGPRRGDDVSTRTNRAFHLTHRNCTTLGEENIKTVSIGAAPCTFVNDDTLTKTGSNLFFITPPGIADTDDVPVVTANSYKITDPGHDHREQRGQPDNEKSMIAIISE